MYTYLYLKYLENPYLAKSEFKDHNPFENFILSNNQILFKLHEINNKLNNLLTKV